MNKLKSSITGARRSIAAFQTFESIEFPADWEAGMQFASREDEKGNLEIWVRFPVPEAIVVLWHGWIQASKGDGQRHVSGTRILSLSAGESLNWYADWRDVVPLQCTFGVQDCGIDYPDTIQPGEVHEFQWRKELPWQVELHKEREEVSR